MIKKKNVIIAIAMPEEGLDLIQEQTKQFKDKFNIEVLLTDIGLINATYVVTKKIIELKLQNKEIYSVINLGTAGGRMDLQLGDLVECSGFCIRDFNQTAINFPIGIINPNSKFLDDKVAIFYNNTITDYKKAVCNSGNNFENGDLDIKESKVIDMEAAAIAKVCIRENINFISVKYISDVQHENEGKEWRDSLKLAPQALSQVCSYLLSII